MRDLLGMPLRVIAAPAIKRDEVMGFQPVLRRVQRMLPRQDKPQRQAASAESIGDGSKFDGFWTGSDNDVDTLD